jgi:hypothetical protein
MLGIGAVVPSIVKVDDREQHLPPLWEAELGDAQAVVVPVPFDPFAGNLVNT